MEEGSTDPEVIVQVVEIAPQQPAVAIIEEETYVSESAKESAKETRVSSGPAQYAGAWEESKRVHVIADTIFTWADGSTSSLTFEDNSMKMTYDGNEMIARLDEGGNKLIWDDGDTWCRAGLNGTWEEATGVTNVIDGFEMTTIYLDEPVEKPWAEVGSMTTNSDREADLAHIEAALRDGYESSVASDSKSRIRTSIQHAEKIAASLAATASANPDPRAIMSGLVILSSTSFSITQGSVTHTATLDDTAMRLEWADGDVWKRA